MTWSDVAALLRELTAIVQSPQYLWGVVALIILPASLISYLPKMVAVVRSYFETDYLEATGAFNLRKTVRAFADATFSFVLLTAGQAVIGACVLLGLAHAGVNLMGC